MSPFVFGRLITINIFFFYCQHICINVLYFIVEGELEEDNLWRKWWCHWIHMSLRKKVSFLYLHDLPYMRSPFSFPCINRQLSNCSSLITFFTRTSWMVGLIKEKKKTEEKWPCLCYLNIFLCEANKLEALCGKETLFAILETGKSL